MRLTCSVHTFWYWITTGFCLESGFVSGFHMEIWLYQASILTTKPWIGVEVPGRFSPCLSAPYAITNGIWKCLGVCGWNSCLIRTKICHQFNLHLDKIWTDWTLGKNWMMLPSQNQLSSFFLWERECFQCWDCSGGADQAIGDESCEAELHQLLFTSLFYWYFLQGLLIPFCQEKPSQPPPKTLERSPAHCVVLCLSCGSWGLHVINCRPSRCCWAVAQAVWAAWDTPRFL